MKDIRANSFEELKKAISEFRQQFGHHTEAIDGATPLSIKNDILFRGQQKASWKLETTLERSSTEKYYLRQYLDTALLGINEIESFSGQRWNLKRQELHAEIAQKDSFGISLPAYPYLVYLRQFGFPSPLLDWSKSPYVATFFAYEAARGADDVAVYCYAETPNGSKGSWGDQAMIDVQGPYVTTDKRHFSQRAWYTVARQWDEKRTEHYFVSHEEVFQRNDRDQDVLVKISMPSSIRKEILTELSDYNINYFTLFHSEDALIKSIAMRAFDFGDV